MILEIQAFEEETMKDLSSEELDIYRSHVVGASSVVICMYVSIERWKQICNRARQYVLDRRAAINVPSPSDQILEENKSVTADE